MLAKMVLLDPSRNTSGGGRVTFLPRPREGLFSRRIRNTRCSNYRYQCLRTRYLFICVIPVGLEPSLFLIFRGNSFVAFSFKWILAFYIRFFVVDYPSFFELSVKGGDLVLNGTFLFLLLQT